LWCKDNKKCIIQITSENVGFIKDIILEVRTYFLDEISLEFSSLINHVLLGDGKRWLWWWCMFQWLCSASKRWCNHWKIQSMFDQAINFTRNPLLRILLGRSIGTLLMIAFEYMGNLNILMSNSEWTTLNLIINLGSPV